jgi:hypothetical protein
VAGQEARLNKGQLGNAKVLIKQGMVQAFLFAFLVGFDDKFAPGVSEFHSAAFAQVEMAGLYLLTVDKCDRQAIRQPGAEFFHEVQGERRAIWTIHMQEPDEWVEADAGQSGDAIVSHEGVEK